MTPQIGTRTPADWKSRDLATARLRPGDRVRHVLDDLEGIVESVGHSARLADRRDPARRRRHHGAAAGRVGAAAGDREPLGMKPPRTIATPSPFQEGGPLKKINLTDWDLPEVTEGLSQRIEQMRALLDQQEDMLGDYKTAIQAAASEALRYAKGDAASVQMLIADYEAPQMFTGDALRAYVRLPLGPEFDEPEWEVSFRDVIASLVECQHWRGREKYLAQVRDDLLALADIIDANLPPAKRRGTAQPAGNG